MSKNNELFRIEGYASKEELWFSYYLSELKAHGLIKHAEYQPEQFVLSDEYKKMVFIRKKNHNEPTDIKLLNDHKYTPDWRIIWEKKAEGICFWRGGGIYDKGVFPYSKTRKDKFVPFVAHSNLDGEIETILDVKGVSVGRSNTSGVTFPLNQKWMMASGVFVQKVVVSLCEKGLFSRTFFPRAVVSEEVYKRDCQWGKEGETKIKVDIRLLEQWLKIKQCT